jgi:hypothetical protein
MIDRRGIDVTCYRNRRRLHPEPRFLHTVERSVENPLTIAFGYD